MIPAVKLHVRSESVDARGERCGQTDLLDVSSEPPAEDTTPTLAGCSVVLFPPVPHGQPGFSGVHQLSVLGCSFLLAWTRGGGLEGCTRFQKAYPSPRTTLMIADPCCCRVESPIPRILPSCRKSVG